MQRSGLVALLMAAAVVAAPGARKSTPSKLDALKQDAVADVESRAQFSQQMVDQIYPTMKVGSSQ